jgi:putative tricarboxylic transport membrane protein
MMRKDLVRDGEVLSGALLAALGAFIVIEARQWGYYASTGPGPGFLPTIYGLAMIALSLLLIANKVRSRPHEHRAVDWPATRRALFTWTAFVVAAALLKPLGFVLSFALLTFAIVAFVFRRPLHKAAATAVLTAAAFYLTFPVALGVALPTGWLGF